MENIKVGYRELGSVFGVGFYHQFIVYTNSNGTEYAVSAWKDDKTGNLIYTAALFDKEYNDHPEFSIRNENSTFHYEDISTEEDLSSSWNDILDSMSTMLSEDIEYNAFTQNSNTAVADALKNANLNEPTKDSMDNWWSPASEADFPLSPADVDPTNPNHQDYLDDINYYNDHDLTRPMDDSNDVVFPDDTNPDDGIPPEDPTPPEPPRKDPLVLDTDKDGFISTIALEDSNTYFDITGDGIKEKVSWIDANDGILAFDKNSNGKIDGIDEVFGNLTTSGFDELKQLIDSNNDETIDRRDELYSRLKIWHDTNVEKVNCEAREAA